MGCEETPPIPVELRWRDFRPACLVLRAEDTAAPDHSAHVALQTPDAGRDGARRIAVWPGPGWGPEAALIATAHERACDGPAVAEARRTERYASALLVTMDLVAADGDNDGFVARDAGTDCDDGAGDVYPGAVERCDGVDQDCDGEVDEGTDGGPASYYRDHDGDGHGAGSPVVVQCGGGPPDAGMVAEGDDCADEDPFTFPGAPEICDGRDNDCAPGTPADTPLRCSLGWRVMDAGGATNSMRSIGLWDGGAWIAGTGTALYHRPRGAAGFTFIQPMCSIADWYGAWAHPATGVVYLAGQNMRFSAVSADRTCPATTQIGLSETPRGISGTVLGDGGVALWAAATSGTLARWRPPAAAEVESDVGPVDFRDIEYGPDGTLWATGTEFASSPGAKVYRRRPDASWEDMGVEDAGGWPGSGAVSLNGLDVVRPDLVYVVGHEGTVLEWDGVRWRRLPPPPGPPTLYAVAAWGRDAVYVASGEAGGLGAGHVLRFERSDGGWTDLVTGAAHLRDLAGTSPEDLWACGENGVILHRGD
jgi:hypothetical protein